MSSTINIRVRTKDESSKQLRVIGRQVEGFARGVSSAFVGMGAAIAGVVGGLGSLVLGAAKAADDLSTLSAQTGIGVVELQEWGAVARESGTDLSTLARGVTTFANNLDKAADSTSDMAAALRDLGINLLTPEGKMRSMNDLFPEIIRSLAGVDDPLKRAALASQLFGAGMARDLLPILEKTPEEMQAIIDRGHELNLFLSKEQVRALNEASGSWKEIRAVLTSVRDRIALAVLPVFERLVEMFHAEAVPAFEALIAKVQELADRFSELPEPVQDFIIKGAGFITALSGAALAASILSKVFKGLLAPALGLISLKAGLIIAALALLGAALWKLWNENEEFREKVTEAWEAIKGAIQRDLAAIQRFWEEHGALIMAILGETWNAIVELVGIAVKALIDVILGAFQFINGLLNVFIGLFLGDWERYAEGTQQVFDGLWRAVKAILVAAFEFIDWLFHGQISAWFDAGKNLMKGLWEGIKSVASGVADWVSNFVSSMVEKVKSVLKISSPSGVFADIGADMMAGLQQGIQGALGGTTAALGGAVPAMGMAGARGAVTFAPSIAVNGSTAMNRSDFERMLDGWWQKAQREIG